MWMSKRAEGKEVRVEAWFDHMHVDIHNVFFSKFFE